ncbi:hypothetical protein B0J11DRAFT_108797 [Dendryphion nanum]|uniref:Zn(2)-C6 fungal-type domain-containing protein n=1 Tax=Dendryphion nanum TaxID=256645 RepID=A0A9P9IEN5_9PLEO|nr:hypothetical protein B0J11DRAFT_108797 [Dendryphion nanum]
MPRDNMESAGTSVSSNIASYGYACSNCVRAKCKCVVKQGTTTCERCHRLNRQCIPGEQIRKRAGRKPSKRAQLEDRLDNLVTLLQAQQSAKESGAPVTIQSAQAHPWSSLPSNTPVASSVSLTVNQPVEHPVLTPAASTRTHSNASPAPSAHIFPLDESLGRCLHTFRSVQLKCFPCVLIPVTMTVSEMERRFPFLWLNIRTICAQSTPVQMDLALQTREIFSRQVLIEGERNVDLLLGVLMQISWTHFFFRPGKPFLGILSNIAKAMVYDLRLLGPIGDSPAGGVFSCPEPSVQGQVLPPSSSHEQRRALLGCYIMSSSVSSLCRYAPMQWDLNVEEAASSLQSRPECPDDELLVAMSRISRIIDDTTKLMRLPVDEVGPLLMHVKPLLESLDRLKSTISQVVLSNNTVHSYLISCEMTIYELALFRSSVTNSEKTYDFRRIEYLNSCLKAARACTDHFFAFDVESIIGMNFFLTLHCLQGLRTLYRLSIFDELGWDRAAVRRTSDVIAYLQRFVTLAETVHRQLSGCVSPDFKMWSASAEKLKSVIPLWKAGLDKADGITARPNENVEEITLDPMILDFLDDSWYTDIFNSIA